MPEFLRPDIEEFRNRELVLNAFVQRWSAHCPNGVAYCNPPYNFLVLGKAVRMAWEQAQAGLTVVCLLPYFKSYDWYENVVKRYGERREIPGMVVCDGFGIQKGTVRQHSLDPTPTKRCSSCSGVVNEIAAGEMIWFALALCPWRRTRGAKIRLRCRRRCGFRWRCSAGSRRTCSPCSRR